MCGSRRGRGCGGGEHHWRCTRVVRAPGVDQTSTALLSFPQPRHVNSMIPRRTTTCLRHLRHPRSPRCNHGPIQRRNASTASGTPAAAAPSAASPLGSITSELDKLSPRFDVPAGSIEILRGPPEFYEALKVRMPAREARKDAWLNAAK